MSEKLDGIRAYWNGTDFLSRAGNRFDAPEWFTKDLPTDGLTLDGELFCGRGEFQKASSIVRSHSDPRWSDVTYLIFDAPSLGENPFEERMTTLSEIYGGGGCIKPQAPGTLIRSGSIKDEGDGKGKHIRVVGHSQVKNKAALEAALDQIDGKGGEGLMLRQPGSKYVRKRHASLLKVKSFMDFEVKVTGHQGGDGKHTGMMGALHCILPPCHGSKEFKVGTGFSDHDRSNPPKIGAIITIRCPELTSSGKPRFPVFINVRQDMNEAQFLAQVK